MPDKRYYAEVRWHAQDVVSVFPHLTEEEAEEFLANNAKYIANHLTEIGFGAIQTFGDMDMSEGVLRKSEESTCENCGKPAEYHTDLILCPNCEKNLTISVVCKLRDDTSIPKTYRSIFRDYMKWRIKREEEGLS